MYNKSTICRTANTLIKEGHSRSDAFRLAWRLAKGTEVKVAGVSFGKRPAALERLTHYGPEEIRLNLVREENPYDSGAVMVIASVAGKGSYCIGYIPRTLAGMTRYDRFWTVLGGRMPPLRYRYPL
ncbi:MAG: hypothetical protein LBL26_14905 [Peptococcaceae bacterium]|jgi:hypothetical protein|nr:hypothetical protein [Peptococcaceae bacterium]